MRRILALALFIGSAMFGGCGPTPNPGTAAETRPADSLLAASPCIAPPVERLTSFFPDGTLYREHAEPFPYLAVHTDSDSVLGYMTTTDLTGTTASGFGGPIPVRVFLDAAGAILGVDVLENLETPAYLDMALSRDAVARLKAYIPDQEEPVEAVTLATVSSEAVIEGVTGVADRFAAEVIGR